MISIPLLYVYESTHPYLFIVLQFKVHISQIIGKLAIFNIISSDPKSYPTQCYHKLPSILNKFKNYFTWHTRTQTGNNEAISVLTIILYYKYKHYNNLSIDSRNFYIWVHWSLRLLFTLRSFDTRTVVSDVIDVVLFLSQRPIDSISSVSVDSIFSIFNLIVSNFQIGAKSNLCFVFPCIEKEDSVFSQFEFFIPWILQQTFSPSNKEIEHSVSQVTRSAAQKHLLMFHTNV